jgi:hypothetical protein
MKIKSDDLIKNQEEEEPPGGLRKMLYNGADQGDQEYPLLYYSNFYRRTLTKTQRHYFRSNGHAQVIRQLRVRVVSDIDQCYLLWKEFSPNESLFDTWEFRYAFWKGYHHQPYFIVLSIGNERVGLLPLWYEGDKKKFFWFGSWWQEDNTFFVKHDFIILLLVAIAPTPLHLNAILPESAQKVKGLLTLEDDDSKYVLNLSKMQTVDDYLSLLNKKRRYNIRRDYKRIQSFNPRIMINNFSDFDVLVKLSKKRFAEKGEETDWEDPRRVETFRQVLEMGRGNRGFSARMITVEIGGEPAGVDLMAIFNKHYYTVKCGYDVKNYPGIGSYMNLVEIEDALKLGMSKIDILAINYGWKERLFETVPLLKLEKY